MLRKKIALGTFLILLGATALLLGFGLYLADGNQRAATSYLQKLSSRQGALHAALKANDPAVYEFETDFILRNAQEYPSLVRLELRHEQHLIVQLSMPDNLPPWTNNQITQTPRATESFQWFMEYKALTIADFIILGRIIAICILLWAGIIILLVLFDPKQRQEQGLNQSSDDQSPVTYPNAASTQNSGAHVPATESTESHKAPEQDHTTYPPQQKLMDDALVESPETSSAPSANHGDLSPSHLPHHEKEFLYRLDKELARAAENSMDLAICLLQSMAFKNSQENAYAILLKEFTHEDLIFPLSNSSFALIFPYNDLDQAIVRIELFLKKTQNNHYEHQLFSHATAGLSSRSGRLIEAKRVYKEAIIALRRSDPLQARISGFRADPTRYRHFLTHFKV
jgi:hypothetical protein